MGRGRQDQAADEMGEFRRQILGDESPHRDAPDAGRADAFRHHEGVVIRHLANGHSSM